MRRPTLDETPLAVLPRTTGWPTIQEPPLRLRVDPEPDDSGRRRIRLHGEFDAGSVDLVCAAVDHVLRSGRDVVVDLGAVEFCDASAARALLACAHQAAAARRTVAVANPRPFQRRLLTMLRVDEVVTIEGP
ncbi:STAS domain-containing protein [Kineococcus aurantiacus]|uniref:Anti-anti-sigma factor n=1 Tax=Kineococcus aurantiacus TaxID=37633 RepID=A0A7Y9J203_9ACTN|nr:anti-anti-sigma factor [Kineococcus aurantiacus]